MFHVKKINKKNKKKKTHKIRNIYKYVIHKIKILIEKLVFIVLKNYIFPP